METISLDGDSSTLTPTPRNEKWGGNMDEKSPREYRVRPQPHLLSFLFVAYKILQTNKLKGGTNKYINFRIYF